MPNVLVCVATCSPSFIERSDIRAMSLLLYSKSSLISMAYLFNVASSENSKQVAVF